MTAVMLLWTGLYAPLHGGSYRDSCSFIMPLLLPLIFKGVLNMRLPCSYISLSYALKKAKLCLYRQLRSKRRIKLSAYFLCGFAALTGIALLRS
jgi:hypothetical protein